jgi:hypothetical protein
MRRGTGTEGLASGRQGVREREALPGEPEETIARAQIRRIDSALCCKPSPGPDLKWSGPPRRSMIK